MTLSGTNTYTGTTTISAGTLALSNGAALADTNAVNLTASSATLLLNASETIGSLRGAASSSVNLGGNTLTLGDGANTVYAGVISGSSGAIVKQGSGTLTLSGANTYAGSTTISAGSLILGANNVISRSSALVMSGSAIFDLNGYSNTFASLTGLSGNLIVNNQSSTISTLAIAGGVSTYAGIIADHSVGTGSVAFTLNGGTLSLTNLNTYTGVTTVGNGATLVIANMTNGGSASGIGQANSSAANIVFDGGTLKYTGAGTSSDRLFTITTNGGTINASGSGALVLTNTRNIELTGSGTHQLTLAGTNVGANSMAAILADSGSNLGSLYKDGLGTWTVSGNSMYTGATTIHAGTLVVSGSASVSNSSGIVIDGTLDISNLGGTVYAKTISSSSPGLGRILIGGDRFTITNASGTFYGDISGSGSLALTGGTLTLAGANTFTGGISINNATLWAASSGALSNGVITSLGAQSGITVATDITIIGAVKLVGNIAFTGNQTYQNVVIAPASGSVVTLSSTAGNISMLGTIDGLNSGIESLSIVSNASPGSVTLGGSVGSSVPLNNLSVTATRINLLADTYTAGTQTYTGSTFIGDASYLGQTATSGFLLGRYDSTFTDSTEGLLIKYLAPTNVQTMVSRDPSIVFNGTIDDTIKNTHTLIVMAISDGALVPSVAFRNSIGSSVPLYGLNVATYMTALTYGGNISFNGAGVTTYTNQVYSADSMQISPSTSGGTITFSISDRTGIIYFRMNPIDPTYPGYRFIRGELNPVPVVVSNYLKLEGNSNIKASDLNGTWNAIFTGYVDPTRSLSSSSSSTSSGLEVGVIKQNIDQNQTFSANRGSLVRVGTVAVSSVSASSTEGAETRGNAVGSPLGELTTQTTNARAANGNSSFISARDQAPLSLSKQSTFNYQLPSDTFVHSIPGTSMTYVAKLADGSPLPTWMRFNPTSLGFSGTAPKDAAPNYEIVVEARDDKGNKAAAHFAIQIAFQ